MKYTADRFSRHLFVASVALLIFAYGMAVGIFRIFPFQAVVTAAQGFLELRARCKIAPVSTPLPWYFKRVGEPSPPAISNTGKAYEGLNLVVQIATGKKLMAKVMDMDGKTLHVWDLDWFRIWPDATHLPDQDLPKSPPGTLVDSAIIVENGDIVFTYAGLGLVRLDRQGKVVWRLPRKTHHTIKRGDNGNLWVCGLQEHVKRDPRFPNRVPPFDEETIMEVTPDGKVAQEWSVEDILRKNGLTGLLYLGTLANKSTQVPAMADILHLNEVEPFPARLKEAFFKKGDILVSLRNANTVFVFNRETQKIKFISTGKFIRQHAPDFIDGNRFSVFDNNLTEEKNPKSRILIVSAPDDTVTTYYEGTQEHPFYTVAYGSHQWLPNGDLLITESLRGRAFEITPRGDIVWQYVNYIRKGVVGLVEEVQRLPPECASFFRGSESGKSESQSAKSQHGNAGSNQKKGPDKGSVKK
jgi:hypothetical protein